MLQHSGRYRRCVFRKQKRFWFTKYLRFQNEYNKVEIELRVVQFWTEIKLVITNRTPASRSCDFVITRMNSVHIALHSVQLPLYISCLIYSAWCLTYFTRELQDSKQHAMFPYVFVSYSYILPIAVQNGQLIPVFICSSPLYVSWLSTPTFGIDPLVYIWNYVDHAWLTRS